MCSEAYELSLHKSEPWPLLSGNFWSVSRGWVANLRAFDSVVQAKTGCRPKTFVELCLFMSYSTTKGGRNKRKGCVLTEYLSFDRLCHSA